ncbi:hypothetical protein [Bacillus sp. FJAT-28004]|uniref:hypothetical protein n=1 Tax=Bacillus sp. FJAT-28004 TaxID=1679165 RepID=UPI0006B4703D|nr:hypothetical protein [Bacillus sp. FJAT-28004]
MLNVKVIYEDSGEDNLLIPIWMIIDSPYFDWGMTLFINIKVPFERTTFEDIDPECAAVTVPSTAYTRHIDNDQLIGISLPIVWDSALKHLMKNHHFTIRQAYNV